MPHRGTMALPQILAYHKVDTRFEFGVTRLGPRVFSRQMRALAARGWTALGSAGLAAALAAPDGGEAAPRAMVLTFDDGYAALADAAFPVLAELGFRALVFVITDFVGRENTWDVQVGGRVFRHLTWEQLGAWQERGIEVHAHGATHRRLTWLSDAELEDELGRSREEIGRRLGAAPTAVAYPFNAVDARVEAAAARTGFTLGFAGPRFGRAQPDPLALGRRTVYGWDVFAPPLVSRGGPAGVAARAAAAATTRFSVVTSALKRVGA